MCPALLSLGWDDFSSTAFEPYAATHLPGRVARVDRGAADVLTDAGPLRVAVDSRDDQLAVGDWVAVSGAKVHARLPRRTSIRRAVASGRSDAQVIAANVDTVLVVIAAVPEPPVGLIERLVTLGWDSGATPIIVLTKRDLTAHAPAIADDARQAAPGVEVVTVDATSVEGVAALLPHLGHGRTFCLVGRSGAGKSTLANTLLGADEQLATGDVRRDGKGRHTTTHRELVVTDGRGVFVDTPGLRGVGLWLDGDGLERTFSDVEVLIAECRFNDCGHTNEPGCAVLAAIDDGRLSELRVAHWRKLRREAAWRAGRTDARYRIEQQKRWKAIHLEVRRSGRSRP